MSEQVTKETKQNDNDTLINNYQQLLTCKLQSLKYYIYTFYMFRQCTYIAYSYEHKKIYIDKELILRKVKGTDVHQKRISTINVSSVMFDNEIFEIENLIKMFKGAEKRKT